MPNNEEKALNGGPDKAAIPPDVAAATAGQLDPNRPIYCALTLDQTQEVIDLIGEINNIEAKRTYKVINMLMTAPKMQPNPGQGPG